MKHSIFGLGVLLVFLVLIVPGLSANFADAPQANQTVLNESVFLDGTQNVSLDKRDEGSRFELLNITDPTTDSVVNDSEYEFYELNGSIRAVKNSSSVNDSVYVDYRFYFDTRATETGQNVLRPLFVVLGVLLVPFGAMIVIAWMGALGGGGRR